MVIFKKSVQLHDYLAECRKKNQSTGFVPTMGALHPGHISLINASKNENEVTVCSIFVNPTQFNDPKDFEKYPVTIESDIYKLETNGCDILFLPSVREMYPEGINQNLHYNLGYLETILEGKFRPGHFQGVCMVVERLLKIVMPDKLYLGQKDFQQCMVIKKLIELMKMESPTDLKICPIVREKDGLAMSSRNMRLKPDERKQATGIYETLLFIKQNFAKAAVPELKEKAALMLTQKGFKVNYVEMVDAENLLPVNGNERPKKIVALIAAYLNEIRLIDNMMLE